MSHAQHDPTDPFHASAYCRPCRTERAAGLTAYTTWRARHTFPADQDHPERVLTEPLAVVRADRAPDGARTGRWVWWIEDEHTPTGQNPTVYGFAPTWPGALAQAEAALIVERMGIRGLVAA